LQEELVALSAEDIDRGWPEALKQEFESLRHRSVMAKEEVRLWGHMWLAYSHTRDSFCRFTEQSSPITAYEIRNGVTVSAVRSGRKRH
jgi:hypothetical protein